MKLFIDENLSPTLVRTAQARGVDATCTRDRGKLGLPDHAILATCLAEDRILVTENDGDFRALCSRAGLHPGLILVPCVALSDQQRLLNACLDHIEATASAAMTEPRDYMVNRVIEIDVEGGIADSPLPDPG